MRLAGELERPAGLGRHDHISWPFDGLDDLLDPMVPFIAEGLDDGLRVQVIVGEPADVTRERLAAVGDVLALERAGRLELLSGTQTYGASTRVDGPAQARAYAQMTDRAVADGLNGLRTVADVTPFVADPADRAAFARYERLSDRMMVSRPFSAVCGFDRSVTGDGAVGELACSHPATRRDTTAFALHWTPEGLALRGELDALDAEGLREALAQLPADVAEDRCVRIDVDNLRFADHRTLLELEAHADRTRTRVVLTGARPIHASLATWVGAHRVEVEVGR